MSAAADRNLLFGVLSLHADLIDAARFAEACSAWAGRKDAALADLLVERGWLTPSDRADVEKLLQRKLAKHGGDARASLAEVATDAVRQSLAGVADPDVLQSLTPPPAGHVLVHTADFVPRTQERYTLSRLHATGGIGRVWLARDASLGRDVALKELRPERAGQPTMWGRFLREAQVTGQLEHPGIVPVYELGRRPEDDAPFYTMRFVRGRTLAEAARAYHERRRRGEAGPLELRELLTAFVGVCNAVAYAHSRGVLHRDLKPQNVVLGDYGEVMVLDWGLAKVAGETAGDAAPMALPDGDSADRTVAGQVMGTPAYMAPEQAEGRLDLLEARTDVYGLGAVLYQVLAGRPPFAEPDTAAVLLRVVHEAPEPLRRLVPAVPRALEAVCLRALAKRPADRYASAKDLADEVRHWLADEPVAAYREPAAQRLGRWARRHRTAVAAGVAALSVAVLVLAVAAVLLDHARAGERAAKTLALAQEEETRRERDRAEANFRLARGAVDQYLTGVGGSVRLKDAGLHRLRKELLEEAGRFYRAFIAEHGDDPAVQADLAHAHMRIGFVTEEIGAKSEARAAYEQALAVRRRLADAAPADAATQTQLAETLLSLGSALQAGGDVPAAERAIREAVAIRTRLADGAAPEAPRQTELARAYTDLSYLLVTTSRAAEAADASERAIARLEAVVRARPEDGDAGLRLVEALRGAGRAYRSQRQNDRAEARLREGVALGGRLAAAAPADARRLNLLASVQTSLGALFAGSGRMAEAAEQYATALATAEQLVAAQPDVIAYQFSLASNLFNVGYAHSGLGKHAEGEPYYRRALAVYERLAAGDPASLSYQARVGGTCGYLGRLVRLRGDAAGALPWLDRGIATLEGVLRQDAKNTETIGFLTDVAQERALTLAALGRLTDAAADWDRALALAAESVRPTIRLWRAVTVARAGDPDAAVTEAAAAADAPAARAEQWYIAAKVFAAAAGRVEAGRAAEYADRAMTYLQKARAANYFRLQHRIDGLRREADFEPLRKSERFRQLLAELPAADAKP